MHEHFTKLPNSLQPKVTEYATTTAKKAENICKRNGISKATAAAIVADVCDMLAGEFKGMHATYEQMQEVAKKSKRSSWERTELNALAMVAEYYARIVERTESGSPLTAGGSIDTPILYQRILFAGRQPEEEILHRSQYIYFTLAILIVGECCNATEEELQSMGGIEALLYEPQRSNAIATALNMQRQRKQMDAEKAKRRKPEIILNMGETGEATELQAAMKTKHAGVVRNPQKKIRQFQNITNMLGGELQTAKFSREHGDMGLRPLRIAIAERIAEADKIRQSRTASVEDKQRAEDLVTNADSIYKAIDALHIIIQELQPTSRTNTTTGYTITPHRFAQIATGQENPNQQQVINLMRALDFLSTERMQVVEEAIKKYSEKDENGQRVQKKKRIQTFTRFTAANTRFYGEFGEEVPLVKAITMDIHVDKLITEGRSEQYKEIVLENGKKENLLVAKPNEHYLQIQQIYAFNSEVGSRFRNILISKSRTPHMAQDKLLAAVFNYDSRLRDAKAKAEDALAEWEHMKADGSATQGELLAAQKKAEDTAKAATPARVASKHRDRDLATLKELFARAVEYGIIKSYYARGAAGAKRKKNGEYTAVVWEWLRPSAEEVGK